MSPHGVFLQRLLVDGVIHMDAAPSTRLERDAAQGLRSAYATYGLSLAGPAISFDESFALAAARVVEWSAWLLLNPRLPVEDASVLRMPGVPTKPEHHVAADLTLRFLPALHRRAVALMQGDVLTEAMARTLREWPLSGVLADIAEPPLTPPEFAHPGLSWLYAERLAQNERPGWFPSGADLEHVALVWEELGKNAATLPA